LVTGEQQWSRGSGFHLGGHGLWCAQVEERVHTADGALAGAAWAVEQLSGDLAPSRGPLRRIGKAPLDGGGNIAGWHDFGSAAQQRHFVRIDLRLLD
jgi:hypothetical protein